MYFNIFILITFLAHHTSFCTSHDIIFPGLFDTFEKDKGHLKPFGWQRKPKGRVIEYDHPLPAEEFFNKHVKINKPLVYRQVIAMSPALALWSDDYLREKYGDLDVLVELKKENRDYTTGRMRFRRFLDEYKEKEIYIVSLLPQEMMQDIQAINTVLCGTFKNFTHESNFWMSNGGTRSVIHYDADENFHCVLSGRKDFILIERKYEDYLYMDEKDNTAGSNFSPVNPDKIDLKKYPDISKVQYTYATLTPGDCIYIPRKHIHQVRSYSRTLAVTTLFTGGGIDESSFDPTGCKDFDMNAFYTMADIDFHWTYNKGDETIDMGYMNVEHMRLTFLIPVKSLGAMNYAQFEKFFLGYGYGENPGEPKALFQELSQGRDLITVDDVRYMSRDLLKLLCRAIDPPHGPVSKNGEEVYFLPGDAPDNNELFDDSARKRSAHLKREFEDDINKKIKSEL